MVFTQLSKNFQTIEFTMGNMKNGKEVPYLTIGGGCHFGISRFAHYISKISWTVLGHTRE